MKILLTGFDPFDREKVNPAFEAVKLLPGTIAGAQIVKLEVPTQFVRAGEVLEAAIRKQNEIGKYYYRNSDYFRFLAYDKCIRHALMHQPWKDNWIAHYTLPIA